MVMSVEGKSVFNNVLIVFGSVLLVGALLIGFRKKDVYFVQEASRPAQAA